MQRRTQLFQRPIELPPLGPSQPRAVALQQPSNMAWIVLGVVLSISTIGSVIFAATQLYPNVTSSGHTACAEAWLTSHPLLGDLDHDGFEDAIGFVRCTGNREQMAIRAVSGGSGKTLWQTPLLGTDEQNARSALALAPGFVLFGDTEYKPRLEAYDVNTGAKRWSITPTEAVRDLCGDREGHVKLVTKDEAETSIELATGAVTPLAKSSTCVRLSSTESRVVALDTDNPHWGFAPPGMKSDQIFGDPSSWILAGYKSPGTDIPMIAVIDDHEQVSWTAQLASTDPMSSQRLSDQIVACDATLVVTAYARKDDAQLPVLVAFDRARGTRLFETRLPRKGTSFSRAIALEVGPTAVWVATDDGLQVYDRRTGALRWRTPD